MEMQMLTPRKREIVWMPIIPPSGLVILLDRTFADACARVHVELPFQFGQNVWSRVGGGGINAPAGFLSLREGTLLVDGFYKKKGGIWLQVQRGASELPLVYHNHGMDVSDRFWILKCFQAWVDTVKTGLGWD